MRSLTQAAEQFAYRPATPDTAPRHAAVRLVLSDALARLWDVVPDGPEKTLAVRKLQECGMYANLAVALTAPLAAPGTAAVARVLPEFADPQGRPPGDPSYCAEGCLHVDPAPAGEEGCGQCFLPCSPACPAVPQTD